MNKISDELPSDEMPFINTKFGPINKGTLIDFEGFVSGDTDPNNWYQNQATGRVGDQPI